MHSLNIQLSDDTYAALAAAAASYGRSVESVAADQLKADFTDEPPESFFTPDLLASIDGAFEEAERVGFFSLDQVREERLAKSKAWRENLSA